MGISAGSGVGGTPIAVVIVGTPIVIGVVVRAVAVRVVIAATTAGVGTPWGVVVIALAVGSGARHDDGDRGFLIGERRRREDGVDVDRNRQ